MSSADYVARYPRRKALKDRVQASWLDEANRPSGNLDSSLKKHTSLLNRLRSALLLGPAETLIKEIDGLTLTKYLEEIAAACFEGASRGKGDPEIAVDVIAHLHTRLTPDFMPLLIAPLLVALAPSAAPSSISGKDSEKDRERDEKERAAKQRILLRILAELAMVHAWKEGSAKGVNEVVKVLKGLMTNDPQFLNLPLVATFVKHYNRAFLGPQENATAGQDGVRANGIEDAMGAVATLPNGVEELVSVDVQEDTRKLFVAYFHAAAKTLIKGQTKLLEQDKRNHDAYIKSGEIFEDRQQAYEKMIRAVERLTSGIQSLADLLGLTPPMLPTAATLAKGGLQIVESQSSFTVRDDGPVPGGIWDDEEERIFYEDLIDLRAMVPAGLLGIKDKQKQVPDGASGANGELAAPALDTVDAVRRIESVKVSQKAVEEDVRRQLADVGQSGAQDTNPVAETIAPDMIHEDSSTSVGSSEAATAAAIKEMEASLNAAAATDNQDGGDEEEIPTGPAARLAALFAALPEASNRETVDKLAVEFAFLNSKGARKRLINQFGAVPKNRTDLLPHYSRFIAILDSYMPDVGAGVIALLDEELRYLQRKKAVRELDGVRLKNVRFYGELAKFKVARPHTILHVLKVFLDDFKPNIENTSNLLETCGRFLLRYEGTAETAKSMVELMRRKEGTQHLDNRQHVLLENAFYQCNPPERVVREVVELPPMHSFVQHLLHDVLMKRTLDKVLKLLRKLHWEDPEIFDYILMSFTEVWEVKFGNIPFFAALVYELQRYHPEFSIAVVDQVMEDIKGGMEENIFKFNQRRISSLKYLGELYMYRVLNAAVVFDVLWLLISFGHAEGLPMPGRDSPFDAVDDFFRVRLVCTLLDACGACFDRGAQKRKLDHFLVVFQLYVLCKTEVPMDVEFMLSDTLEAIRPKTPPFKTFAEAAAAVDELLTTQSTFEDADDSEDGSEDGGDRAAARSTAEEEEDGPQVPIVVNEDDDQDDVVVIRENKPDEGDVEARSDFDREFAKMLADTTDSRRERKTAPPVFDTAVPHIKRNADGSEQSPALMGSMAFTLLSKKGNRAQMRTLDIPVDAGLAVNLRTHQEQSKAEQEQLKRLVLQNKTRQERAEMQAIEQHARNHGIKLKFASS